MRQLLEDAFASLQRGEQTRIAKELGVPVQTVNKWAKGYNAPGPDVDLRRLEQLLHLDVGALGYTAGTRPQSPVVDTAALLAEIRRQGAALKRLEARIRALESPPAVRSDPASPRSREAPTKAGRGKVAP